jgi:hypothetical protein
MLSNNNRQKLTFLRGMKTIAKFIYNQNSLRREKVAISDSIHCAPVKRTISFGCLFTTAQSISGSTKWAYVKCLKNYSLHQRYLNTIVYTVRRIRGRQMMKAYNSRWPNLKFTSKSKYALCRKWVMCWTCRVHGRS